MLLKLRHGWIITSHCLDVIIDLCLNFRWSVSVKWTYNWIISDVMPYSPDSKVHGANMGPTWVLSAPDGPHVGLMNLAIRIKCNHQWSPVKPLTWPVRMRYRVSLNELKLWFISCFSHWSAVCSILLYHVIYGTHHVIYGTRLYFMKHNMDKYTK